jgi:hypothetical protein
MKMEDYAVHLNDRLITSQKDLQKSGDLLYLPPKGHVFRDLEPAPK